MLTPMGVEAQLWRALAVFRALALAYEAVRFLLYAPDYARAALGWAAIAAAAAWTVVVVLGDRDATRRRQFGWRLADLVVAGVVVGLALGADAPAMVSDLTVPMLWATGSVVAMGLGRGWGSGVVAALAVGVEQVLIVGRVSAAIVNGVVVMGVAGGLLGWVDHLAREAEGRSERAAAAEAQQRERERLSRAVHDGVLQVLGLVQHRAPELGGDGVELGRLAGEQEAALRALITRLPEEGSAALGARGEVDLGVAIAALASARVATAVPADPVPWPADRAGEIVAAVRATLDNVDRHAGPAARAWVLLEEDDAGVVVTVRDDGVGMAPDRPAEAAREGRLGLRQSVVARVAELGGTATVSGAPGRGVEVELRVPRPAAGGAA